jgi:hypothetical protein
MACLSYAQWRQVKGTFYWCKFSAGDSECLQIITKWLETNTSGWSYVEVEIKEFLVTFELESELIMFRMWLYGDPFSGGSDDA